MGEHGLVNCTVCDGTGQVTDWHSGWAFDADGREHWEASPAPAPCGHCYGEGQVWSCCGLPKGYDECPQGFAHKEVSP